MNVTQKTSWFIFQRIWNCFNIQQEQLKNKVESYETHVGGYRKNGQGGKDKMIVVGLKEREGKFKGRLFRTDRPFLS